MADLPKNGYTLFPADDPTKTHLPEWPGGPPTGRVLVELTWPVTLTDDWQQVIDTAGRTLEVRSADCGAGCRCAGEVRLIGSPGRQYADRVTLDRDLTEDDEAVIKSLLADHVGDKIVLVAALREAHAGRSDEDIAYAFDAPGARAHNRLSRILMQHPRDGNDA